MKAKLTAAAFLLSSCSYLVNSYNQDDLNFKKITPKNTTNKTYCSKSSDLQLISENENSSKLFKKMLNTIQQRTQLKLKPVDKAALMTLMQINFRPDLSSPSANLQLIVQDGKNFEYFSSSSEKQSQFSYFYTLESFLKKYRSRYTLTSLVAIYDKYAPQSFSIGFAFQEFLEINKEKLQEIPTFKRSYFRGSETLREGERVSRVKLSSIVKRYYQSKRKNNTYVRLNSLTKYSTNSTYVPSCNFSMQKYKDSQFNISKEEVNAHVFGLKEADFTFMASSTQGLEALSPLLNTPLFEGKSNVRGSAICQFENRLRPRQQTWLISSTSRDPSQHLYHLVEYNIEQAERLEMLDNMLKFSRHLFLKNPIRLVIESRRTNEKHISELLQLDIPIYNSKKLGKIWGYFSNKTQESFLLDTRRRGHITCQK